MKSYLHFYYVPFTEDENKLIEDMSSFLSRTTADDVESEYVSDLGTIDDFQFIKHDVELTIKIVSSQLQAPLYNANYLAVVNQNEATIPALLRTQKTYYYFIKSIRSLAENTLELTLRMDTLNTLGTELIDTNNWLPSTFVEREHSNRFWEDTNDILPHTSANNRYAIKVDEIPEGIQFPLYKQYKHIMNDTLNSKFYLVYRSSFAYAGSEATDAEIQSKNAVKCFLVAEKGKNIPMMNYYGNAVSLDLQEDLAPMLANVGDAILFDSEDNPELMFQVGSLVESGTRYFYNTNFKQARNGIFNGIFGVVRINASEVRFFTLLYKKDGTSPAYSSFTHASDTAIAWTSGSALKTTYEVDDISNQTKYNSDSGIRTHTCCRGGLSSKSFEINGLRLGYRVSNYGTTYNIPSLNASWSAWTINKGSLTRVEVAENVGITPMMTIDEIDRTDSRLIRIIELPYAPNEPVAHGSGANLYYDFGSNWSSSADYDADNLDMVRSFQLIGDIEPDFTHTLSEAYNLDGVMAVSSIEPYLRPWYSEYETKLRHSDYQKHMFVYDNFSMELKEELLFGLFNYWGTDDAPSGVNLTFTIQFTASSNLTSGNLFSLHAYYDGDDIAEHYYKSDEVYPLTLIGIRNNEVNLYNASYLNYIRSGFNYDMKSKYIQGKQGMLSAEQGLINGLLGSVNSVAGGSASGGIHAVVGAVGSFYNYNVAIKQLYLQQLQTQNQIDKTLAQSAIQATSVAGADNLSLFNKYNGNKLLLVEMSILNIYKEKIAHLFHYFGYNSQKYKVPNFTGRCFFNYVKCQPALKDVPKSLAVRGGPTYRYYGFSDKIFKDAISKFSNGVFIIHKFAPNEIIGNTEDTWNISMDKENWENFILSQMEV